MDKQQSAFAGGTTVTFNSNGTYSSGPKDQTKKQGSGSSGFKNMSSEEKKKTKRTFLISFLGGFCAFILVLLLVWIINLATGNKFGATTLGATSNTAITQSDNAETLAEAVSQKCLPSVVSINVYSNSSTSSIFGQSQSNSQTLSSLGSGVVISNDGYVVTNQHVISGASSLKVSVGGNEVDADIVGQDSSSDIAVIKLKNASNLVPIELADSDNIKVGEWVMSIGSPFGLEQSVATGIVSAKSRSQVVSSQSDGSNKVYTNLIQTDAAINPGNSGGALVDANGKLIGINALISSSSGNYSGVGFAIPSNSAIDLAKQIIEGKTPSHAQLGVTTVPVTSQNAQQYGWSVSSGAYVRSVVNSGAADKAGIKTGDIITKVGDTKIDSSDALVLAVRSHNPGDTVKVELNRNGETITVDATLTSDEGQSASNTQNNNSSSGNSGSNNSKSLEDIYKYFFGR